MAKMTVLAGRWRLLSGIFLSLPAAHFALYVLLRLTGVYYAFFDQGWGDIDGETGVLLIDLSFMPYMLVVGQFHHALDQWGWMEQPTGG